MRRIPQAWSLLSVLWLTFAAGASVGAADPLDWPSWRGPEQNGISRETGIVDSFDARKGTNVLWKNVEAGGRSTPLVLNGKLYTVVRADPDTPKEAEKLLCLNATTGEKLWENRFNVWLSDVPDTRLGWANCIGDPETGRIYVQGVCGIFLCVDGETGKTVWSRTLHEELGLLSTYGGRTNSPVLFDNLVIISAVFINWGDNARPNHRFLAMDKGTGEIVWFNGTTNFPDDTTYSTPWLGVLDGKAQLISGAGDGHIWSFQPRTGKVLWKYRLSLRGVNVSPIAVADAVFASHSEENIPPETRMGAMAAIRPNGQEVWNVKEVMAGKVSPCLYNGKLYTADDGGKLFVVDPANGKLLQEQRLVGAIMRASLLIADGKLYACTTSAFHSFTIGADGLLAPIVKQRLGRAEEVHGSPIVSHGRLYLPTTEVLYCLGKADAKPALGSPAPPTTQEPAVAADQAPAQLLVVPAESLVKPGESVQFRVRLYNAVGQFLREEPAKYAADANGSVDAAGKYTADAGAAHVASIIKAEAAGLTGTARVRIVPPLPWKFDFSGKDIPVSWVGARYRHVLRMVDGDSVMVKRNDIPKGTRSRAWFGPSNLSNYTIQADVRGTVKDKQMPDIGLIAQGYTLDLMGQSQQLQIRLWDPELDRFSLAVPFKWQADVWYTLKFQASAADGKAVLRGKCWPRGSEEPAEWTITATDEAPQLVGSPGLYGNAKVAELFLDNVSVVPNP